jgi:hypothetical protein
MASREEEEEGRKKEASKTIVLLCVTSPVLHFLHLSSNQ